MEERRITSADTDEVSASKPMEPTQLRIDGCTMMSHEIERAIELAMGAKSCNKSTATATATATATSESDDCSGGNMLSLTSVGLTAGLTEDLIRLIQQKKEWDSISLANFLGDRTLCNDLLLACTTHSSIKSLTWRTHIAESIHNGTGSIMEPTEFSTVHALLYGLKYNSHLTKLEATGLVLDVNLANLLSRALVRNRTLVDLTLNGTRFLSENSGNENRRADENHRGTKNMTVQTLSFGLRFNRTIESLSLDMCDDLEDEDIACLINAVNSDGTVLRRLSLQATACFNQGMSSVAVMLQENVIEELNLNNLVRRRRKTTEPEEEKGEEEVQEPDEDGKVRPEPAKANSDDEEKGEDAANSVPDTKPTDDDQDDNPEQEGSPSKDIQNKQDTNDNDKEQEDQKVRNTSLKLLSMTGNGLNDDYLESLLNIFPAPSNHHSIAIEEEPCCSRLEEINLLGNRFSNHGIKELLKKLPRFPYLQRLYLGYQGAPPAFGPTTLPPATLSRMMASNPSLLDRNAQFSPASLETEFVAAVAENPSNFRLTDVNIMAFHEKEKKIDQILKYHMRLNAGGRKLLASYARSNRNANAATSTSTASAAAPSNVPLGLWALVVDRANRLYPLSPVPSPSIGNESTIDRSTVSTEGGASESPSHHDDFHAGDVIFCLLHGPMVFENLDRRPVQV